ncbi:MucBP domain-containing protein [Vagococcus entomophilus]|uniref:Gram-positive cocci surface proteins LPxTG domain-containing protein n=1 Tax=Vagococcus entomophilus TaxID=1160095 RepID=A0A430ALK7_9ENTE|nr:MucBP domain-containing protein [Vagococcus entomophilus]RSU08767.1 hypothetical protein CBF30_05975 [Vagococcus entomophilus]
MKKKFLVLWVLSIIGSLSFFGINVHAEESSSKVVTQHVMYDDLSSAEKNVVIQGQPNIKILHDQEKIKLVYKQGIGEPKIPDSNNKEKLSVNYPTTSNSQGSLPKTGENDHTIYWIMGISLTVLTISLFIWKRKSLKTMLVLFIFATGFSYSTIANAAANSLPKETVQTLAKNGTVYSPIVTVDNYEYVGYIYTYSDNEVNKQTGNVTVKYQDADGKSLADDVTLTGAVGDAYSTEQKTIEGYAFKEVQGNPMGTYKKEDQIITFIYEKVMQTGNVTVKYQDADGKSLADDVTLTGAVGDAYSTEQKTFEGYAFKEVQGNPMGTYKKEDQTIVYVYNLIEKDGSVQFILNDQIDDKEIIVWKNGNSTLFPILYYVWDQNDLNSKVTDLTLNGKVGTSVEIPSSYRNLFDPQNSDLTDADGDPLYKGTPVYAVYKDASGELQLAPDYYHFYARLDNYDNKPSLYLDETQVINFYINVLVEP